MHNERLQNDNLRDWVGKVEIRMVLQRWGVGKTFRPYKLVARGEYYYIEGGKDVRGAGVRLLGRCKKTLHCIRNMVSLKISVCSLCGDTPLFCGEAGLQRRDKIVHKDGRTGWQVCLCKGCGSESCIMVYMDQIR